MHTWYKGKLISSMIHALRDVCAYRREKRRFRNWLRAGQVVIDESGDSNAHCSWAISATECAILAEAEYMAFSERHLRGWPCERQDEFWDIDYEPTVPNDVQGFDPEYFKRYHGMQRYDEYYIINGEAILNGGIGLWMEDHLQLMRELMERSWTMRIDNRTDRVCAKGAEQVVLRGATGDEFDLPGYHWGIAISYE